MTIQNGENGKTPTITLYPGATEEDVLHEFYHWKQSNLTGIKTAVDYKAWIGVEKEWKYINREKLENMIKFMLQYYGY